MTERRPDLPVASGNPVVRATDLPDARSKAPTRVVADLADAS